MYLQAREFITHPAKGSDCCSVLGRCIQAHQLIHSSSRASQVQPAPKAKAALAEHWQVPLQGAKQIQLVAASHCGVCMAYWPSRHALCDVCVFVCLLGKHANHRVSSVPEPLDPTGDQGYNEFAEGVQAMIPCLIQQSYPCSQCSLCSTLA